MPKKNSNSLYLAALALFICGIGYLVFAGLSGDSVYTMTSVSNALAMSPDKPKAVRISGTLKDGSVTVLEEGVGVRFQIEDERLEGNLLWVVYRNALPDLFEPGIRVTVEGVLAPDTLTLHPPMPEQQPSSALAGTMRQKTLQVTQHRDFEAQTLSTVCPSKYEKEVL